MSAPLPPVTLTTDFGETDHYVAQMKGVILGIAPTVPVVDVTHAIPPQDIRGAAYLIEDLGDAFPQGTVHVVVVDPGVGSDRAILAVAAAGQFYVAPDNGLLTALFDRWPDAVAVAVTNPSYRRHVVSSTFHGRDVMAPAAAHLARRLPLSELGSPLGRPPVRLDGLTPVISLGRVEGAVAWVDQFGNVITNVPASALATFAPERLRVRIGLHEFSRLRRFYAEVPKGEPLLLLGSSGKLEIAVSGGSAAARYAIEAGTPVIIDAD